MNQTFAVSGLNSGGLRSFSQASAQERRRRVGREQGAQEGGQKAAEGGGRTPVAFSPLAMTLTATSGTWLIRKGV
jgi:hypothetical protein